MREFIMAEKQAEIRMFRPESEILFRAEIRTEYVRPDFGPDANLAPLYWV